jgi:4-hydroxybenzoate polyprenyltransferase
MKMLSTQEATKNFFPTELLGSLKDELIYGGYIPALVGPALVITTAIITSMELSLPILIISYLIPLMVYSFDYYQDMDKDMDTNRGRACHYQRKRKLYPYMLGCFLVFLFILLIFFTNWMTFSFILGLILVGVLYPLGLKKFTQRIPGFKNMYTICIWAVAGTFSIAFYNMLTIDVSYLLIFLFFFLKMLPNTIFFDLKDIKSDTQESLKTFPVILGEKKTLKFLYLLNITAFIPLLLGVYLKIFPLFIIIMALFLLYSFYYLNKTSKLDGTEINMSYFIISDCEFILWPLVLFLGKLSVF